MAEPGKACACDGRADRAARASAGAAPYVPASVGMRPATAADLDRCVEILDDARAFQREQGFVQWTDTYPGRADVEGDLARGDARVLTLDGRVVGYFCLGFDGDPCYLPIDGAWASDAPYAVVHRAGICRDARGHGLMGSLFALVADECRGRGVGWIRVDTHASNLRMQHVLAKNGFTRRGIVQLPNGPRVAFDKPVD